MNDLNTLPEAISWLRQHFWARLIPEGGCLVWPRVRSQREEYGSIRIQGRKWGTHKLAWTLMHGPVPAGLLICHTCDNRRCCNPAHLFLGTKVTNALDMVAKRRHGPAVHPERINRGEQVAQSRLTTAQVREIRARYAAGGETKIGLSREYGMSRYAIRAVIDRSTWAHV